MQDSTGVAVFPEDKPPGHRPPPLADASLQGAQLAGAVGVGVLLPEPSKQVLPRHLGLGMQPALYLRPCRRERVLPRAPMACLHRWLPMRRSCIACLPKRG